MEIIKHVAGFSLVSKRPVQIRAAADQAAFLVLADKSTGRLPLLHRQSGPASLSSIGNHVLGSEAAYRAIFS